MARHALRDKQPLGRLVVPHEKLRPCVDGTAVAVYDVIQPEPIVNQLHDSGGARVIQHSNNELPFKF